MWYSLSTREKFGVACLGAMVLGAGGWVGINKISHRTSSFSPSITAQAAQSAEFPVHVAGAVREPAVITASGSMLVDDAIKEAGEHLKTFFPRATDDVNELSNDISVEE